MRETLEFIASTNFDGADDRAIAIMAKFLVYRAKEALAQPTHEPVERMRFHSDMSISFAPPQRTWVGPTDAEIETISEQTLFPIKFARAIEAKLKELNT